MHLCSHRRPPERGWSRLVWSDYRAFYTYKQESPLRAAVLFGPRLLTNGSLHASLLVRLGTAPGPGVRLIGRVLARALHAISIDGDCAIGPGLVMTHPIGLTLGPHLSVGANAALFHGITLAGDPGSGTPLRIGDDVEIYTGAVVRGAWIIGDRCRVGANAVLTEDLVDGEVRTAPRTGARVERGSVTESDPASEPRVAPLPDRGYTFWQLVEGDLARVRRHLRPDGRRRALLGAALRDRSLRVVVLVRLIQCRPGRESWLWRRLLLAHGCDVPKRSSIGPGLHLPSPRGVIIGVNSVLGSDVTIHDNVTVSPAARGWRTGSQLGLLHLEDGVVVGRGSVVLGPLTIGERSEIGPNVTLTHSLAPDSRCDDAPTIATGSLPHRVPGVRGRTTGRRRVWTVVQPGARVSPAATIWNRAYVGAGVTVGDGAEVGPGVTLDGELEVGPGCSVPANHRVVRG